jgi:hypothetical protein
MTASVLQSLGIPSGPSTLGTVPIITGPTTTVATGTNYQALPTDTFIRVSGGPSVITLPTVAQGLTNGQRIAILGFDLSGNNITVVPGAGPGDNIDGGAAWALGFYASFVEFQCRISGATANWLQTSGNTTQDYVFPLQPALAAGAQGPINLGSFLVAQALRYVSGIWIAANSAALTGGSFSISVNGLVGSPATLTVSSGAQATATVYSPGTPGRATVPGNAGAGFGALLSATVSTVAGFAPAQPNGVSCVVRFY